MYPLASIGFDESVCLWFVSKMYYWARNGPKNIVWKVHVFIFHMLNWSNVMSRCMITCLITSLMIFFYTAYHKCIGLEEFSVWSPVINLESPFHAVWVRFTQTSKWRWIERTRACGLMQSMMEELQQGFCCENISVLWEWNRLNFSATEDINIP